MGDTRLRNTPPFSFPRLTRAGRAEHTSEHEHGTALAFSSSGRLFKFMSANSGGEWKMEMAADRDGLVIVIADLHRLQIASLTFNCETDSSGGEPLALADLVAFADSLGGGAK